MTPTAPALLIVNADDWGAHREGTDAIERCFAAGAISSATAMVHMTDSARAAELARAGDRAIGLHLNLTQRFEDPAAPAAARERQARLVHRFAGVRRRRFTYDPRVRSLVAAGIADQLEAFRELYGREPTHVDSHHHVHLCPDVIASPTLRRGLRVRGPLAPAPAPGASAGRALLVSRARVAALRLRFRVADRTWGIATLHPDLGGTGLAEALECSRRETVEIMVHPSFPEEEPVLLSERWLAGVTAARPRSFAVL